jgi:rhamnogalacturonan acetylesterase
MILCRNRVLRYFFALIFVCAGVSLAQTRPAGGRPQLYPPINPALPTLWIIGDSTVRNGHDTGDNGQWGWGHPIAAFFDTSRINVQNRALGGTSSRSFWTNQWPAVLDLIKPGDYLIMQFGHNDGGSLADPARARGVLPGNGEETKEIDNPISGKHEVVHTHGWYIRQFVADANGKGIKQCIVCSLIPRNHWSNGKVDAAQKYPEWDAEAAKQAGASYVDLHHIIATHYEAIGQDTVTSTYFPEKETTHTDWAGSILNAQCVIEGLKTLDHCDLVGYLLPNPPAPEDIKMPSGKAR